MDSILKQEIKLSDGSYDKVFLKSEREGQVFFDCYVCRVGKLPGLINVTVHARGKRHVKNLQNVPDVRSYREKIVDPVKILPEQSSSAFSKLPLTKKDVTIDSMNLHLSARNIEQKAYEKHKSNIEYDKARETILSNYSRYRKTLDSHPRYAEEWKTFWERKYKEIKKEGKINPADYDYKPEWIKYWKKRIDDLLIEEMSKTKKDIFKTDDVDFETAKFIETRRRTRSRTRSRSRSISPMRKRIRSRSPRRRREPSWSPPKYRRNSKSPDLKYSSSRPPYSPPRRDVRSVKGPKIRDGPVEISSEEDETSFKAAPSLADEKVSFIGVCRLLSALESDVGSMAPKVLDLLTKSLQVEKIQPSRCDEIMMTHENSVLLETVKEKLKGTLTLGMLSSQKENVIKLAIQKIAKLLHYVPVTENNSNYNDTNKTEPTESKQRVHIKKRWVEVLQSMGKSVTDNELDVLADALEDEIKKMKEQQKIANIASFEKAAEKVFPTPSVNEPIPPPSSSFDEKDKPFSKEFEDLSDEDLKLLLSNFSDLEIEEQTHMVNFLTYLEKTDPERVKALKSCVNLDNENEDMVVEDNDIEIVPIMTKSSLTDNLLNFGTSRRR